MGGPGGQAMVRAVPDIIERRPAHSRRAGAAYPAPGGISVAPIFPFARTARCRCATNGCFVAVALLAVAALWIGRNLPMVDMPQHGAQISALREILGRQPDVHAAVRDELVHAVPVRLPVAVSCWRWCMPVTVATQLLVLCSIARGAVAHRRPVAQRPVRMSAGSGWPFRAASASRSTGASCSFLVAVPVALFFLLGRHPVRARAHVAAAALCDGGVLGLYCSSVTSSRWASPRWWRSAISWAAVHAI